MTSPAVDEGFRDLGIPEPDDAWRKAWPVTQEGFAKERPFFLDPRYVRESCRWLGMDGEISDVFLAGLKAFEGEGAASDGLTRLAWHYHVSWFSTPPGLAAANPVEIPKTLGEAAGMFYAILFLSGIPHIRKVHQERAIPEAVTLDTLSDLERWVRTHFRRRGVWGFSEIHWLRLHFSARIYKLGRLQFEMQTFPQDFHAYRNRRTRQVVVFAGEGMRFRPDGLFGRAENPDTWTSEFRVDEQRRVVRGNPILPARGAVRRETLELPLEEWDGILRKGDGALSIHIPVEGRMDHAACGESLRQAAAFFPKHYPEWSWRAFMCWSWLLDPQFEEHLPPESNIVRFLREFYLLPVEAFGEIANFGYIFDNYQGPLDQAPQRTSLQRATLAHLKAGGKWRVGGCALFPEDLDWGAQIYRREPTR
jgi:hypothetical protein